MPDTATRFERLRAAHDKLQGAVAEGVSGDDWKRMLKVASNFHGYSFNNHLMIVCEAMTRVCEIKRHGLAPRHHPLQLSGPRYLLHPLCASVGQVAGNGYELHRSTTGLQHAFPRVVMVALEHHEVRHCPLSYPAELVPQSRDLRPLSRDHVDKPLGLDTRPLPTENLVGDPELVQEAGAAARQPVRAETHGNVQR